eukprot:6212313-Pleurochrysis_carterae.AAC.15
MTRAERSTSSRVRAAKVARAREHLHGWEVDKVRHEKFGIDNLAHDGALGVAAGRGGGRRRRARRARRRRAAARSSGSRPWRCCPPPPPRAAGGSARNRGHRAPANGPARRGRSRQSSGAGVAARVAGRRKDASARRARRHRVSTCSSGGAGRTGGVARVGMIHIRARRKGREISGAAEGRE